MSIDKFGHAYKWFRVLMGLMVLVIMSTTPRLYGQGPGGPAGIDVLIRAENRTTADTPFCGIGGGMVGDKLRVDAFMDNNGVVTGTARFEDAHGVVTFIDLNRAFMFGGGGLLVQDQASQNTVPIWMSDTLALAALSPALVNVELPRGCGNTVSTFTPGFDKVTMQIKFR